MTPVSLLVSMGRPACSASRAARRRSTSFLAAAALSALVMSAPAAAQSSLRETAPVPGTPAPLRVPHVQGARLPNGIALESVEQRELPLVQVLAVFSGGARLDGAKPGMATFVATMLKEGAGAYDAASLQAQVAYLGATLRTRADWDETTVSLKVPVRSLDSALALMADVIVRPTFAPGDVRTQRDLRLARLLQQRDDPGALASLAFAQTVFPAGHPYHHGNDGDSVSTAALDSASVRAFYRRTIRPDAARFIVVGDLSHADAQAAVARHFGTWKSVGSAATVPAVTVLPRRQTSTHVYFVDKPDAAQSVISIGWPGVSRVSADYAALMVMNSLLGGSFTSRLNMNLREQKGFTYGAGSGFTFRKSPGPFTASASVRTDVTDSSLVEFFKELRLVRDARVPDEELARAKAYVELGLPGSLESTTQVAGSIAELATFGLPLTDLSRFATQVRAVTAADVQRVARRYLTPDQATVVVVGDRAKVGASIEALKLGPITILDVTKVAR